MLRSKWEFKYSAADLSVGAKAKKEYHSRRLAFWKAKMDECLAEVKESGIEVSMSAAGLDYTSSNKSRPGMEPRVMVRADLQRKLTECHDKITEHTDKLWEYDSWVRVFEGNKDERLTLNSDDFLYFFAVSPRADEE